MGDKRQKIQLELDFKSERMGEARRAEEKGNESSMAEYESESLAERKGRTRSTLPSGLTAEPPCADPHARWCGRGRAVRLPPIPIEGARTPSGSRSLRGRKLATGSTGGLGFANQRCRP